MRKIKNNKITEIKTFLPVIFILISQCMIGQIFISNNEKITILDNTQIVILQDTISQSLPKTTKIYIYKGTQIVNKGAQIYGDLVFLNDTINKIPQQAKKRKKILLTKKAKRKKTSIKKKLNASTIQNDENKTIYLVNFQNKKSATISLSVKYILYKIYQKLYFFDTGFVNNIFESKDSFIQKTYTKKNIIRPPPSFYFSSVLQFI